MHPIRIDQLSAAQHVELEWSSPELMDTEFTLRSGVPRSVTG